MQGHVSQYPLPRGMLPHPERQLSEPADPVLINSHGRPHPPPYSGLLMREDPQVPDLILHLGSRQETPSGEALR